MDVFFSVFKNFDSEVLFFFLLAHRILFLKQIMYLIPFKEHPKTSLEKNPHSFTKQYKKET